MDNECTALAIRIEDQQWYKDMMFRIKLKVACDRVMESLRMVVDATMPVFTEMWESIKDVFNQFMEQPSTQELLASLQNLADLAEDIEIREDNKKEWRKNLPVKNQWYNRYQKNVRDKRSEMKHFTIYRRE